MWILVACIIVGLLILLWSAERFVESSSHVAQYYGVSPLVIAMVIIGFGTSAPELVVSVLSSVQGNPGVAIGNAYGSNITNIALILGVTALLMPITVHSQVLKKELPILAAITLTSIWVVWDFHISRMDAVILLVIFSAVMFWTIKQGLTGEKDALADEVLSELKEHKESIKKSFFFLFLGLVLLIVSSRLLVYGAVGIANTLGVSDVIIGLTVVAIGTSLPELASSVVAARKGESDIALGNVLGSNLFNTLAVVGLSGVIHPLEVSPEILYRDVSVMTALTMALFVICYGFRGKGRINRIEGGILLLCYVSYTYYLVTQTLI